MLGQNDWQKKNSDKDCSPLDFTGRGLKRRIKKQVHRTKPISLRSVISRACSRYYSALFQNSNNSPSGHISDLSNNGKDFDQISLWSLIKLCYFERNYIKTFQRGMLTILVRFYFSVLIICNALGIHF